jgi:hypothetical protein
MVCDKLLEGAIDRLRVFKDAMRNLLLIFFLAR